MKKHTEKKESPKMEAAEHSPAFLKKAAKMASAKKSKGSKKK